MNLMIIKKKSKYVLFKCPKWIGIQHEEIFNESRKNLYAIILINKLKIERKVFHMFWQLIQANKLKSFELL